MRTSRLGRVSGESSILVSLRKYPANREVFQQKSFFEGRNPYHLPCKIAKRLYNRQGKLSAVGQSRRSMGMAESETLADFSEQRRKEVFQALVELQDEGVAVAESRATISERFGLTEAQIRRIEEEGMDNEWPPL